MKLEDLKRLEAAATPDQYWQIRAGQCYGLFYGHFAEGPHCSRKQALDDSAFIVALRNHAKLMFAVIQHASRLLDNINEFDSITDNCFVDNLYFALKALEEAT